MAIPVYLWLKDDGGNPVNGSVDVQQREGSIEITALAHGVSLPTDDLSGKIVATREQYLGRLFAQKSFSLQIKRWM